MTSWRATWCSEGHIDHCVRKSIRLGLPPITALQIATINTARHYRLRNFGAIAPRYWADFIVFDSLKNFAVRQVYKKGVLVAEERRISRPDSPAAVPLPRGTMNLRYQPRDLEVKADARQKNEGHRNCPAPDRDRSKSLSTPKIEDGEVVADSSRDILKLVVVERHRATGNVGVGFVRGFKLKRGAHRFDGGARCAQRRRRRDK